MGESKTARSRPQENLREVGPMVLKFFNAVWGLVLIVGLAFLFWLFDAGVPFYKELGFVAFTA